MHSFYKEPNKYIYIALFLFNIQWHTPRKICKSGRIFLNIKLRLPHNQFKITFPQVLAKLTLSFSLLNYTNWIHSFRKHFTWVLETKVSSHNFLELITVIRINHTNSLFFIENSELLYSKTLQNSVWMVLTHRKPWRWQCYPRRRWRVLGRQRSQARSTCQRSPVCDCWQRC